jgi:hypothetical protein
VSRRSEVKRTPAIHAAGSALPVVPKMPKKFSGIFCADVLK